MARTNFDTRVVLVGARGVRKGSGEGVRTLF